ncbi:MAG: N-acetylglucosamine-6-phosphate deacetylase [Thermoanaerobaculia bacterium]|jgi:N-acetylglucosamine-6-phosphate deacetylase|nr:N-acetylglucosamine-6-phosphate deacetylase [Thermoanaerobaculia bacterium]
MSKQSVYGRAFVAGELREGTLITIDDQQITDVRDAAHAPRGSHVADGIIVPGFIDVHVHGGAGADFMDATLDATQRVTRFHASEGTTAITATTLSASREHLRDAVAAIARASRAEPDGAAICAIHLEGPYINAARAGAQDVASIRHADIHELAALLAEGPHLRWMVTVAPECEGVRALIEHFRDRVLFSIGHTAADYAGCVAALEWGASHFTHLFNAMTGLDHRRPGAVGAALTSVDATAELIADGVHVHPAVLRMAALTMPHRVALITDAVRACGMRDGRYKLYEHDITVADGAARLANGTLAGSVLTMRRAVQNMVELAGLPLELVLPLATEVPARILEIGDRKGKIAPGYDADLVVLTERFEVSATYLRGEILLSP